MLAERAGPIADHGSTGPGHACLLAAEPATTRPGATGSRRRGVEITHEHEWGDGRRSFYFKDPAGNLLEIADGDLWPSSLDAALPVDGAAELAGTWRASRDGASRARTDDLVGPDALSLLS